MGSKMTPLNLNSFINQQWEDLLLLHWAIPEDVIRNSIPDDLEIDLFENQAWVSVVGFRLTGLRIRPIRWLEWGEFNEVNLRTYVRDRMGRKGVWFHSLDSCDLFSVIGAKLLYGLNYRYATIERRKTSQSILYQSSLRSFSVKTTSRLEAQIDTCKKQNPQASEPIDHFLLERYRFWSNRKWANRSHSASVRHKPYNAVRLQNSNYQGSLFSCHNLPEPEAKPTLAHFCEGFPVTASAPSWVYDIAGQANQI